MKIEGVRHVISVCPFKDGRLLKDSVMERITRNCMSGYITAVWIIYRQLITCRK